MTHPEKLSFVSEDGMLIADWNDEESNHQMYRYDIVVKTNISCLTPKQRENEFFIVNSTVFRSKWTPSGSTRLLYMSHERGFLEDYTNFIVLQKEFDSYGISDAVVNKKWEFIKRLPDLLKGKLTLNDLKEGVNTMVELDMGSKPMLQCEIRRLIDEDPKLRLNIKRTMWLYYRYREKYTPCYLKTALELKGLDYKGILDTKASMATIMHQHLN